MRFKLDENVGRRGQDILRAAGHDVATVRDEGLGAARDEVIFEVCRTEGRALITLDHDFGNVLRFPPESAHGIVVLELPPRPSMVGLLRRVEEFLAVLAGVTELLAVRAGQSPPAWTARVAAAPEPIFLVRAAAQMPRLRRSCEQDGPEPPRRRGVYAPPEFLTAA